VVQQLRETFPEAGQYRFVILDRDSNLTPTSSFLKATGVQPTRMSIRSPWQNGTAERWVARCRREWLDYVIPWNEEHLRRLIREYVRNYHEDRIHDHLGKDTPNGRVVETKPPPQATLIASVRLGGLHHRNHRQEAA
jgi:hypothetical protein